MTVAGRDDEFASYMGRHYRTVHYFCEAEKLSLCKRGHTIRRDNKWFNVFCFAERKHAAVLGAIRRRDDGPER